MNIAIRVDSSKKIGSGHVYRTLTLAKELKYKKNKVIFICQNLPGNLINLIKKNNFKVKTIKNLTKKKKSSFKNHFKSWSRETQINDSKKTNIILNDNKCDWIISDHYGLSEIWEKEVCKFSKLLVIDDLLNKKHFCNLYVHNHFGITKKNKVDFLSHSGCKVLDGLKYTIINKLYLKKNNFLKIKKNNIFVFMGAVDKKKISIKVIKKIKNNFNVTVLLGKNCNYINEIQLLSKKYRTIKIIKKNYDSLKDFYKNYNLIISSGGLSMYEQILCESNSLIISQNKYQEKICKILFKQGYINYLKSIKKINFNLLNNLMKSQKKKKNIIDGFGSNRIVNMIMNFNQNLISF